MPTPANDIPAARATGRLLKMTDVVRETSLHRATIYRRIAEGSFPRGYDIGGGRKAWAECDIDAWKAQIMAGQCN